MKVLITGANGMLGQDLCPYLEELGMLVIATDYDTMDITDEKQTDEVIARVRPDLIIHCAAYTNVDKAESDLENATKLNVLGAKNVAISAVFGLIMGTVTASGIPEAIAAAILVTVIGKALLHLMVRMKKR